MDNECISIKITSQLGSTISIHCESISDICLDIVTKKTIKPVSVVKKIVKKVSDKPTDDLNDSEQDTAMEVDYSLEKDNI
ncbi:SPV127 hypothetical protein [Swinepox virus]|uniref:Uncharacterized protein n=2 Tax=Swinepox virus TaxID=10276 RepID=Q8V3G9_SWPV1|nr:SPV127 hypothetical protein [Swinepox virus]AAL69866.1 SPV127 hypothetical protein [Swinepox virus]QQG31619.1 hypothetical protein [Swinepox virus]UED36676.1 SPV127 hypothetical protein [Swinepox virus]UED36824.1 SPV127 hypothetical protein [Swinepox virus]UUA44317.1 SPV127 [Swinepox virus]